MNEAPPRIQKMLVKFIKYDLAMYHGNSRSFQIVRWLPTFKYFEIAQLGQTTVTCVVNNLKKTFARFGIPGKIFSDNGPLFGARHLSSRYL